MKILVIRYKKTRGVPEGGEKASELNRHVLGEIAGEGNVDTYFIHDEAHRRSMREYAEGVLYMPFGYYFGLTPKRVSEIVSRAQGYDCLLYTSVQDEGGRCAQNPSKIFFKIFLFRRWQGGARLRLRAGRGGSLRSKSFKNLF